jgi:hypothetical protein
MAAFVVRRGRPLVLNDLGPVKEIAESVERWRRVIAAKGDGRGDGDPAGTLRRLLWLPLADAVGDAAIVLVSPDGVLGTFPFAALPGDKDKRYLIEERAMAVVAVPQLLPQLLRPDPKDKKDMPLSRRCWSAMWTLTPEPASRCWSMPAARRRAACVKASWDTSHGKA